MSETLYKKSWEPLSEADKSEMQVVRHKDEPDIIECLKYAEESHGWYASITYISEEDICDFEFLCLTPVEHK